MYAECLEDHLGKGNSKCRDPEVRGTWYIWGTARKPERLEHSEPCRGEVEMRTERWPGLGEVRGVMWCHPATVRTLLYCE